MWPGQKVSDQGPGKTNYGVAVLISLKEVPFRHHTLVPAVLPLSEAFLELTLGNSQQLCCYISLYLLHAVKPIPLKKFSPLGIKKIHMGPCPVNRGVVALVGSMFSQEVLDSVGQVGRAVSWCSCQTCFHDAGCLHCTTSHSQWRT